MSIVCPAWSPRRSCSTATSAGAGRKAGEDPLPASEATGPVDGLHIAHDEVTVDERRVDLGGSTAMA